MPYKPLRPCNYSAACKELVKPGQRYCEEHKKKNYKYQNQQRTDQAEQAFYRSARWQKLRRLKLAINPLCEICQEKGRTTAATIVHHKDEIKEGGELLPAIEDLQSVCLSCHSRHHIKQLHG